MAPPSQLTPSTPSPSLRRGRSRATATPATPATPANAKKPRIRWTTEMEEAMLEGLVDAVRKGYRADSSYTADGWKLALDRTLAVTLQPITMKQLKSKHDAQKEEWKTWKELCALSGWRWDEDKGVPVASQEVIETYFEANPDAAKFCNAPPAFLNLLQELFDGFLATGSNARSIDDAIESCVDPEILAATASQATDSAYEEDEDFELEPARSSLERSQSSSPSVDRSGTPISESSSIPGRASSLAIRKRAVKQAAREAETSRKRRRGQRIVDMLEETVEQVTREMRAIRHLIAQKSPQEKASIEFISEFSHLDPTQQLVVLRAFETESTARLFLVTAGTGELRRSFIDDILASRREAN